MIFKGKISKGHNSVKNVYAGFQAPLHKKLGLKLGLFSHKFRAFVNEK